MNGDFTASYLTSCMNSVGLPETQSCPSDVQYSLDIAESAGLKQLSGK